MEAARAGNHRHSAYQSVFLIYRCAPSHNAPTTQTSTTCPSYMHTSSSHCASIRRSSTARRPARPSSPCQRQTRNLSTRMQQLRHIPYQPCGGVLARCCGGVSSSRGAEGLFRPCFRLASVSRMPLVEGDYGARCVRVGCACTAAPHVWARGLSPGPRTRPLRQPAFPWRATCPPRRSETTRASARAGRCTCVNARPAFL